MNLLLCSRTIRITSFVEASSRVLQEPLKIFITNPEDLHSAGTIRPPAPLGGQSQLHNHSSPYMKAKGDTFAPPTMGFVKLELRCPKKSLVVASPDPEPSWTLDDLFAEISSLELKIGGQNYAAPYPLKQEQRDGGERKPFVMSVDDFDVEDDGGVEFSSEDEEGDSKKRLVDVGARFSCDEVDVSVSEDSDDGLSIGTNRLRLLEKMNLEESMFFEIEAENQMKLKEDVRNKLSELEAARKNEAERSASVAARIDKLIEVRQEMDRRLDKQYQRKMAEVLDTHLSAVQRDHQQKSQIEERRLRDDAEEEKRKAILREKQELEKAKEVEARIKAAKLAEEAQKAALEASQKALRETAAKEASDKEMARARDSTSDAIKDDSQQQNSSGSKDKNSLLNLSEDARITGIKVLAANAALEDEERRSKMCNEVSEKSNLVPEKELNRFGRQIYRVIRQISGTVENVSAKSMELLKMINDPAYPHSISKKLFAKKVVALGEDPMGSFNHFACARVILLVNSKVPDLMDLVLAELNKACIYTVPKHLRASEQTTQSKEYWKLVGYHEEDGKLESTESYLNRVQAYVKLYAAIVQTEIDGVKNPHGLNKGWSWLARFLNTLPATRPTAYALEAFLEIAGYAMHRRYKSQFKKILNAISQNFLPALEERRDQKMKEIIIKLDHYLGDKVYLNEPAGWRLQSGLLSSHFDL